MISQNDVTSHHGSFAFTCPKTDIADTWKNWGKEIEAEFPKTSFIINQYVTKVSIVGIGLISNVGVAAKNV